MKNLIFSSFALFVLSLAPAASPLNAAAPTSEPIPFAAERTSATANDESLIVRSKVVEGGLEVLIANMEQSKTVITLISLDTKKEMFSDRVRNHNGYSYNLNLDDLKKGRYLLSVTKGKEVRKQVLLVSKTGIACSAWK